MITVASSSAMLRTKQGIVLSPSSSQALFRLCPDMISYPPSFPGRTIRGLIIPCSLTLSTVSCIFSSSSTRNGWELNECSWSIAISSILSADPPVPSSSPNKAFTSGILILEALLFLPAMHQHLLYQSFISYSRPSLRVM